MNIPKLVEKAYCNEKIKLHYYLGALNFVRTWASEGN